MSETVAHLLNDSPEDGTFWFLFSVRPGLNTVLSAARLGTETQKFSLATLGHPEEQTKHRCQGSPPASPREEAFLPGIQFPGSGRNGFLEEGAVVLEKLLILLQVQTGVDESEPATVFLLVFLCFLQPRCLETLDFLHSVGKENPGLQLRFLGRDTSKMGAI